MVSEERIDQFLTKNRRRNPHFSVAPRYGPGSPALVDQATALRVARDEEGCYQHANVGRYGEVDQTKAQTQGLVGIAEVRVETKKGWDVLDLITGERYLRHFKAA